MPKREIAVDGLFAQLTRLSTLYRAWDKVEDNHGCAGVDGVTVEKFAANLEENIAKLQKSLLTGKYHYLPLLRFSIEKPHGGKRALSVPTVRDRVAQTAATIVLLPVFEKEFEDFSFAYRKGKSHQQAIEKVRQYYQAGYRWIVDIDIDAFFDEVNHTILLARLAPLVKDPAMFKLLATWIKGKIYDGKTIQEITRGIPQGSPISPLLANLYLDTLDDTLLDRGQKVVRFADDFLILCKNEKKATAAYQLTKDVLAQLDLKIDEDSQLTNFDHGFEYLGATFVRSLVLQKEPQKRSKQGEVERPPAPATLAAAVRGLGGRQTTMAVALREVLKDAGNEIMEEFYLMPAERKKAPPDTGAADDPYLRTLFIQEQGAVLEKEDERLLITKSRKVIKKIPAIQIDQIIIFGSCGVTTPAMKFCLERKIPITLLSSRGQYYGVLESASSSTNVLLQKQQFARSDDLKFSLDVARAITLGKIKNCRTLLRRHRPGAAVLAELETILDRLASAEAMDQVRGYEGAAAAKFFPAYATLLKDQFGFTTRNRQPPTDPVNSMLSFGYTLLFYNIFSMVKSHGLHPYVGFFHELRSGHPALVSDLIEEFRSPIVDSLVLYLVNSKILTDKDFALPKEAGLPCLLSDDARKLFIHHFEQKMNAPMTHPHTGFKVDYRRCINLQVAEMARCVRGESPAYRPMEVG